MDEEIEALWLDRELHSIQGSVFDDVMLASSVAADIALDADEGGPDPDGRVARVVIREPSERMLRTVDYFNVDTVMQSDGSRRRLVLGPASLVDASSLETAIDACEAYASVIRIVFGEADGQAEVLVMSSADAAREDFKTF